MSPNPLDLFRLTNRTALVTGARREIGRAIALALKGAGARLAIHHADTAEETADDEHRGAGRRSGHHRSRTRSSTGTRVAQSARHSGCRATTLFRSAILVFVAPEAPISTVKTR